MAYTERYVRADAAGGGDGTTDANSGGTGAFTLAEAITHSTTNTGQRYNVKAGVYANTTTTRTFSGAGTTTAPNWWRGFKTAAGDMDGLTTSHGTFASGTEIPVLTFTTGGFAISGAHQMFSNFDVQGARAAAQLSASAVTRLHRVRVENTNAAAASRAASVATASGSQISRCWFKATSSATSVFNVAISGAVRACVFTGGGHGIDITTASSLIIRECVFRSPGGDGINSAGTAAGFILNVERCTFYGCGSDGIEFATLHTFVASVTNCVFNNCGGYGINNSTGANTNLVWRENNVFYNNTSGNENGFGDSPSLYELTDGASSFVNAPTDLRLASSSGGYGREVPVPEQGYSGYADAGAVQHQDRVGPVVLNRFIGGGVNRA